MSELTPTTPLADDESVQAQFHPDRSTYIRDHTWLAALAMAAGMGILWLMGNAHVWTGAVGGLAAIAIRAWYVSSDELNMRWDLTDQRLLGPQATAIELARIDKVRTLGSAVQVITNSGEKYLLKYQPDAAFTRRTLEAAKNGGQP